MELLGILIVAVLAWAIGVIAKTPFDLRRHDAKIRRRDSDLAQWLEDDDRQLRVELKRLTNSMAASGQLYSGALRSARQSARDHVLRRWDDQVRAAHRDLEDVQMSEHWWHGLLRKARRRPLPDLVTPGAQQTRDVLARWRTPEIGAAISESEPGVHPGSVKPLSPTGPFRQPLG